MHDAQSKKVETDVERLTFNEENSKILMESFKFYGRNINILEMYDAFQTVYDKYKSQEKKSSQQSMKEGSEMQ